MKKYFLLLTICLITLSFLPADIIRMNDNELQVSLLRSTSEETLIQIEFGAFGREQVEIDGNIFFQLSLSGEDNTFERGAPSLPFLVRSIIIPDLAGLQLQVIASEFTEFDMKIAPSKGILSRQIDPAQVPYEFNESYLNNEFYPSRIATLGEPYILRDFRGLTVSVYPFVYNPVTGQLRVYHHLILRVVSSGTDERNQKIRNDNRINRNFSEIYRHHFLNYNTFRYNTVEEQGRILVIAYSSFMTAMQPYVDWKNQRGIPCTMVNVSTIGSTASQIKTYIQNQYNLNDGLTFVQLVGDAAQIPAYNTDEDPQYSLLEGGDSYPDIFVGRFSAGTVAEVATQVDRTIYYERDITTGDWLFKGFGIGSDDGYGNGDDGEYDWEHLRNIRTHLYTYTYQNIDEFYEGSQGGDDAAGNPNATMVLNAVNQGRGIGNYCGHGYYGGWSTSGFNSSNVNSLTNDNMFPFIHSVACNTGEFQNYTSCFAETWLRATNNSTGNPTGAIAFYGSTISQSWSPPMRAQDHAIDLLVGWNYYNNQPLAQKFTIGGLWYNGSCNMMDVYGTGGINEFKHWTIFGDASLTVRTNTPADLGVIHTDSIEESAVSFPVETDCPGALACLVNSTNEIITTGYTDGSGHVILSPGTLPAPPAELLLTVTASNYATYQATIEVTTGGTVLDPPANVVVDCSSEAVQLSWDPVAGANSYIIYHSLAPEGSFDILETVNAGITSRSYSAGETRRFYRVTASTDLP
ncbi:MAG: hypothetical protein JW784_04275 [Candidatus Cloacimonetes bacterium]|nr:hypothetical protein [Candidatus Cloacimonadota bacterium]